HALVALSASIPFAASPPSTRAKAGVPMSATLARGFSAFAKAPRCPFTAALGVGCHADPAKRLLVRLACQRAPTFRVTQRSRAHPRRNSSSTIRDCAADSDATRLAIHGAAR